MNIQFYFEKLLNSTVFKEFSKENPEAYLCSGFFVIDRQKSEILASSSTSSQTKEGKDDTAHLDYFLPKEKEMVSFHLDSMQKIPVKLFNDIVPEPISSDIDFEFNEIENLIIKKMGDEKITNTAQKMIFSLQKLNGKEILVGNVFISMLGIIKVNIDLSEMKIVEFQKKSIFDIVNVLKKDDK